MLRLIFRSPWQVPFILAVICFLAGSFFYKMAAEDEVEAAIALKQGMPAPVSLNAFDPAKDIHPADEVHVIGWVNPDYNYELTETSRKRSDVVRRMFVMFGPEDGPDSKQVRAVVLMPEYDVDRFVAGITENMTDPLDPRLIFSLNGTVDRSPTLDNMANDALAEKGLTKAPGFRFIEIWPAKGREAALAPDPKMPYVMWAVPGVPGLFLLLIAIFKFRGRKARALALSARQPAATLTMPGFAASALTEQIPPPAAKPSLLSRLPEMHKWRYLALAFGIYALSTWVGSWQLAVLGGLMGVLHLVARVKKAMDKGVNAVASAVNTVTGKASAAHSDDHASLMKPMQDAQAQQFAAFASTPATGPAFRAETPESTAAPYAPAAQSAIQSVPTLSDRLSGLQRGGTAGKLGQFTAAALALAVLYVAVGDKGFGMLDLPKVISTSGPDQAATPPESPADSAAVQPAALPAAEVSATAESAAVEPAAELQAPASEPAAAPVVETATVAAPKPAPAPVVAENPLIPAAASLRPTTPQPASEPAAAMAEPAPAELAVTEPAPEVAAPAELAPVEMAPVEMAAAEPEPSAPALSAAEPAADQPATPLVTETAAEPAPAATDSAATAPEPAEPADSAGFLAALQLPGFGNLALIGSVAGAVLLSIAAFALMRGRQSEPPQVFAGRDPWERLARDVRGKA